VDPGPERIFRPKAVVRAGVAIFALFASGLTALLVAAHVATIDPSRVAPVRAPAPSAPTPTPIPLSDLGRAALAGVVTVEVEVAASNEESLGTGWIFDARGDIVTNAHVVAGHTAIRVTDRQDHTELAVVIGTEYDHLGDIALLRPVSRLHGAALPVDAAAFATVPVGVIVLASSTATGNADMTAERAIGLDESVPLAANGGIRQGQAGPQVYDGMIHLQGARIYEGNSGGPVLDVAGRVVGVVTLASPTSPDSYAIPINRVLAELTVWSRTG
jgi:S1-C subfamily serine protease